jgi:hypothetical protein
MDITESDNNNMSRGLVPLIFCLLYPAQTVSYLAAELTVTRTAKRTSVAVGAEQSCCGLSCLPG